MTLLIRHALLLAAKDMRIFWRDRFSLTFALIFPLVFAGAFTLAWEEEDEPTGAAPRLTVAAADQQGLPEDLVTALTDAGWTADERSFEGALDALGQGDIGGFLLLPADFGTAVTTGSEARIRVVVSGKDPTEAATLESIARTLADRTETVMLAVRGAGALAVVPDAEQLSAVSQLPPLVSLEVRRTGERRYNPIDFTLPGYLTMFVFFVAALGAGSIVLERETRTLERLVSNGVRAPSILAGKFLVAAGRGLTQLAVLWTVGVFALSIDLGASPGAVVIVSLLFALASAAFGIMLATMVDTMRSASSIAMLASLTLAPLGGCWWPLFIAPDWLQALGRLTPHAWANDAFNRLMVFGASASDVVPNMLTLVAFAIVFGAIALVRFRLSPPT